MIFRRLRQKIPPLLTIVAVTLIGLVIIIQYYHFGTSKAPIFFMETSGKQHLEARAACSIESAALHHPYSTVTLYSIGTFDPQDPYVSVLRNIPNVHIEHLNLNELFEGTPLVTWHQQGRINESSFPIENLSNAARLAILWKYGGMYLDTDVIVIRALDGVRNTVALQEPNVANNAVLVFDRKHDFLEKCMADYVQNYSGRVWGNQGPKLITRNLKDVCKTDNLTNVVNNTHMCPGVTLLSQKSFYPIPYPESSTVFKQANTVNVDLSTSYTIHLWAKLSRSNHSVPGSGTLLDQLALNNCPLSYQIMIKEEKI